MNNQQTLVQYVFAQNDSKKTLTPVKTNNIKKAKIIMFSAELLLGASSLFSLILIPIGFYNSYPSMILTILLVGLFMFLKGFLFSAFDEVPAAKLALLDIPKHIKEKNILIGLSNRQGFLLEKQYKAAFLLVAAEEKEAKERAVREEWGIK